MQLASVTEYSSLTSLLNKVKITQKEMIIEQYTNESRKNKT